MLAKLTHAMGPKILLASAARAQDGDFRWALETIAARKPEHMVEIGTCYGVMAAVLGLVCEHVTTVDVATYIPARPGSPGGVTAHALVPAVLSVTESENVTAFLAKNEREKEAFLRASPFDAAFIDGEHEVASVLSDFELCRKCGFVLFHNVATHPRVIRAIQQIGDVVTVGNFGLWSQ